MRQSIHQTRVIFTGIQSYQTVYQSMREFTARRTSTTEDQIWVLQHYPVYTIGSNNSNAQRPQSSIPFIETDRGGQITYHAPGQLIIYLLLDLTRRKLGIRHLVENLEKAIISLLDQYAIKAITRSGFPGVYVEHAKIASVGLRVRNGCCYHGISLNVNMDLSPFEDIVICGEKNLKATQVSNLKGPDTCEQLGLPLIHLIDLRLNLDLL